MCGCVCGLLPKCCQLPGPTAAAAACLVLSLSLSLSLCVCCTCPKSAPAWHIIEPSMQHIAPHFARAPVAPFFALLLLLLLLLVLKFDNSIKCALWQKKRSKEKASREKQQRQGATLPPRPAEGLAQLLPSGSSSSSTRYGCDEALLSWHRVWSGYVFLAN